MKNTRRSVLSLVVLVLSATIAACTFTLPEPGLPERPLVAVEVDKDPRKPENARVPYGPGLSADDQTGGR